MGVVKVMSLLIKPESVLGFVFGVRTQTEMKIWFVTGMCMLKVVSNLQCKKLGGNVVRLLHA